MGKKFELTVKPMFVFADTQKEAVLMYQRMLSDLWMSVRECIEVKEVEGDGG